jgi:dTDP-4-dehydrorhamnose 3,5-epimerase
MIDGVKTKKLRVLPDERGRLMEILRADDDLFIKFGQVYITTVYPGVTKAWHYHKTQHDSMCCVRGMLKLVLYDARKNSPTHGEVNEFFIGEHNPMLIQFPPYVYHGFKGIGEHETIVVNCPTEPYDYKKPDEFRVDPHKNDIPYDWTRKDG